MIEEKKSVTPVDRHLVVALKDGGEIAFRELFFKYGKKLYYFSRKQSLSHELAEGVVQECFAKLWEVRATLDPDLSFQSYIFTIAKNLIYNKSRKHLNRLLFEKHLLAENNNLTENTEDTILTNDYKRVVSDIITELSPRVQKIFRMNRFEGRSNQEIADQLGISKSTVENQIHMALKHIKKELVLRTDLDLCVLLAIMLTYY